MLTTLLSLLVKLLRLANLLLIVYCVMSFVMPDSSVYRKASYYMEKVLSPIRWRLLRWFPALQNLPLDLSPLVLWLLIDIAMALISRLRWLI
ncbi:MAG: YggT family protein [Clostridia bacterium]|nr:YggT family protein [Clostridia bacterium]